MNWVGNWVGLLCFLGGVLYFVSFMVILDYSSWEYRQYFTKQRNWSIGMFAAGTLFFSIAILIGTKG